MMGEGQETRIEPGVVGRERQAFGVSTYMCGCVNCQNQVLFLYIFF